jgi:hypothetical protein
MPKTDKKQMKMTIKKFEQMLYDKHGKLGKADHSENGWGVGGPMVTKLWLYYANGKHVGTYNRKSKIVNFID